MAASRGSMRRAIAFLLAFGICSSSAKPTLDQVMNDVDVKNEDDIRGALRHAVEERDPQFLRDILRIMLDEKGVDTRIILAPDVSRRFTIPYYTLVHYACMQEGDQVEKVQILLDMGADKDAATENTGVRLVHLAAQYNNPKVMRLLLKRGADITAFSSSRMNAATMASRQGNTKVLRVMKEFGGEALSTLTERDRTSRDDTIPSGQGYTPVEYTVVNGQIEALRFLIFEVGWGEASVKEVLKIANIAVGKGKYDKSFVKELKQLSDPNSQHFKEQQQMHYQIAKEKSAEPQDEL